MSTFADIKRKMRLPVIGAPLFIVSNPRLVIAQCLSGVIGSFPALNARPQEKLDDWIVEIKEALAVRDAQHPDRSTAPFAVNQIVHRSNDRLMKDMESCVRQDLRAELVTYGLVDSEEQL